MAIFKKKKSPDEKITLKEYLERKAERDKKKFRLQPYPWPVSIALLVPLSILIILLSCYFFYVHNLGD